MKYLQPKRKLDPLVFHLNLKPEKSPLLALDWVADCQESHVATKTLPTAT